MSVRKRSASWFCAGILGLSGAVLFVTTSRSLGGPDDRDGKIRSPGAQLDVIFSPGGGCEDRISEEIGRAEKSVRVQAFYFTSKPITEALVQAQKRGVEVCVVLDKSQEKQTYGKWRLLHRAGIPVHFDAKHATANNKIILIDHHTIITGSYNFTKSAEEKNAENVLFIKHADDVFGRYEENFELHLEHSKKYSG